MLALFIMRIKMYIKKSVNYDKLNGVIQGTEGHPTVFYNQLVEVFHK